MKKLLFSIALIFVFVVTSFALSENSRVSILTVDSGDELYSYFGHSAIRISDDDLNIDKVYNFGTFDFSTPNFYLKFSRGDLDYCLDMSDFDYFIYVSEFEERNIIEQVLILSESERSKLYEMLEDTFNSADRYYRYDFFRNNCATKIRDYIEEATDKRIDFSKAKYHGDTFRDLITPLISRDYWITLLINLALGTHTDEYASPSDYMFLPMYIEDFLDCDEFVSETYEYRLSTDKPEASFNLSYFLPWIIVLIILILSIYNIFIRKPLFYIVMATFGITGLFLLALSIYTYHYWVTINFNVIWTLPALLAIAIPHNKISYLIKFVYLLILLATILCLPFVQCLSSTFIPWISILIILLFIDLKIITLIFMFFYVSPMNKDKFIKIISEISE